MPQNGLYPYPDQARNQRISIAAAIGVHVLVLLLSLYVFNWHPPDPPLTDTGVELNIGFDAEGYGDLQTRAPANDRNEDAAPNDIPEPEITPREPQVTQRVVPTTPPEPEPEVVTSENESPVEVPPPPKPTERPKPVDRPKPADPVPTPPARVTEARPEYRPETPQPGGRGVAGTGTQMAGNNNGDRPGKVGDQGDPRGTLEGRALYGNPGKGGGASLDMAGWQWDSRPDKTDPFDEEGRIVFQIQVDEEGTITKVDVVEKSVSPRTVAFYRKQVEELTFSKTRDNVSTAAISTGRITIIIRNK